jgi:hypothetical protein
MTPKRQSQLGPDLHTALARNFLVAHPYGPLAGISYPLIHATGPAAEWWGV